MTPWCVLPTEHHEDPPQEAALTGTGGGMLLEDYVRLLIPALRQPFHPANPGQAMTVGHPPATANRQNLADQLTRAWPHGVPL